ncbi:MAG: hypothetical protein ACI8ZZ_001312 [Gammaproteobacteria bacterium]
MCMNIIKKRAIVCVIALIQLLLNPNVGASDEDYSHLNTAQFSEAELSQMLAPIALYPDTLLAHILIASTYPLEVVEAYRWRKRDRNFDVSEVVQLSEKQGWDPSVVALVGFPSVLERLNEDLRWTQNLGDAFLEDEVRVLDTIQALRHQAELANSFDNIQNMRVTRLDKQIVIQGLQKEIVYVPYYDTRVVYGNWHWNRYPPVYWPYRPHLSVYFLTKVASRFHWGKGIDISFNYHFSAFKWRTRRLVVSDHHKTRHYRSYSRIANSYGSKRWQHKPTHRRGVAYRLNKPKSYNSNGKQRKLYASHLKTPLFSSQELRAGSKLKNHHREFVTVNKKLSKAPIAWGKQSKAKVKLRKNKRSKQKR